MKIAVTGSTGLIGSRFKELLEYQYQIVEISTSKGVNILDFTELKNFVDLQKPDIVVHFAAKTNVDDCEIDKDHDLRAIEALGKDILSIDQLKEIEAKDYPVPNSAFLVNFLGTKNLLSSIDKTTMFVYISSDFIFGGNGEFDEESIPSPVNWYGYTKHLGDELTQKSHENSLIIRSSFPYGGSHPGKKDFIQKLSGLLKSNSEVSIVEDQIITPSLIDDIVLGIEFLFVEDKKGKFNVCGSSSLSPYEMCMKMKSKLNLNTEIIPASLEQVYKGKAPRPFKSILKNDKLKHLGFIPKTFDEGLDIVINEL